MKRWYTVLFLILLVFSWTPAVTASSEPIGGCPTPFHLHNMIDHDNHHGPHRHVGTDTDRNGDGWICVQHVGADGATHVHIDNNVPLS